MNRAKHIASRFKQAGKYNGPWRWIDEYIAQVWLSFESYGRVHQVTNDLHQAERLLQKIREVLIDAQSELGEQGIFLRDIGDIYVDGISGGRNLMKLSFYAKAQGKWTEEQQDILAEVLKATYGDKPPLVR